MHQLESIRKAERLLKSYPTTANLFMEFVSYVNRNLAPPREIGEELLSFVQEADRLREEVDFVAHLIQRSRAGEPISHGELADMLLLVQKAHADIQYTLKERHLGIPVDAPFRLDAAAQEILAGITDVQPSREKRLSNIESFIYNHPGQYIKQLHDALTANSIINIGYEELRQDIDRLEEQGRVLTIGRRQGIKRYCFPPPDKVNRRRYWGSIFGIRGAAQDITEHFQPRRIIAELYRVNSVLRNPVILVAPPGTASYLTEGDIIQGYGILEPLKDVAAELNPRGFDRQDIDVVFASRLLREDGDLEELPLVESYQRALRVIPQLASANTL